MTGNDWLENRKPWMSQCISYQKLGAFPAIIMLVFREVKPFASKNSYLLGCPFLIRQTKLRPTGSTDEQPHRYPQVIFMDSIFGILQSKQQELNKTILSGPGRRLDF